MSKYIIAITFIITGLLSYSSTAFAVADPKIATTVTTATSGLKENLISGLGTAIPVIVVVGVIFFIFRYVYRKMVPTSDGYVRVEPKMNYGKNTEEFTVFNSGGKKTYYVPMD